MSDQPGIPAIMVFPPFNPAPRQPEPVAEPVRDQAPAEEPAAPASEAHGHDVAAPPAPAPWDFEAPAADEARMEAAEPAPISEEEDLPWLEVPEPARGADEPEAELKADDTPNWMDWVRDAGQAPPADEPTPIADLQPDDAQPWAPETETAADDWAAAAETPEPQPDPWQAPPAEEPGEPRPASWEAPPSPEPEAHEPDPWQAPTPERDDPQPEPQAGSPSAEGGDALGTELDIPEPELYDLPDVGPSATPWVEAEAPLFEPAADEAEGAEAEPAWELPSHAAPDAPPAWESFAPTADAPQPAAGAEPRAAAAPAASEVSGPFAAVADRLQAIADALRADPGAFLSGAQGGGDPLALLVAGFVLGYNARQGGGA